MKLRWLAAVLSVPLVATTLAARQGQVPAGARESIFDRKVTIEKELVTEIPAVPRLCDTTASKKMRVPVGGASLFVEEEGQGLPLVLINGGPGGTHHGFHPWFSRLKDSARVIYYDQRGCGQSDYTPGPGGYSVEQAVSDLDAIRGALGIDRWVVLGYSYGGILAQTYAMRHPDRLAGLILLGASPGLWGEMQPTRQYDFLSREERARIREVATQIRTLSAERRWTEEEQLALQVFNAHLNGDWKRQSFYRPTREDLARVARYEWVHDLKQNYRGEIGSSQSRIDLTGAFERCPIPTLILEGKWDLTWNTDKPQILAGNHPGSKLVVVDNAGHGIYDEDPDRFFSVVKDFLRTLPAVPPAAVAAYRQSLDEWDRRQKASPAYVVKTAGWGRSAADALAKAYTRAWCDQVTDQTSFLKIGFAHYEVRNYTEALYVFERLQQFGVKRNRLQEQVVGLIWQGHMLDLLGRRQDAVARYQQAIDAKAQGGMSHGQYGLEYDFTTYPKLRLEQPFTRVENREK